MNDGPVLGIDLGTTNSVVAVADGGQARVLSDAEGRRLVPSVVSFLPGGGTVVGYEARERRLVDAENTVYAVKRLIGRPFESEEVARARERFAFEIVPNKHGGSVVKVARGTFALAEVSALVLRELRTMAETALGESAERAVITVPASFNELQRSATKAAGKVAGLEVLRILNEPTAAALAYGYGAGQNERVAVYDLGGGTFDITVLELDDDVFEVLATGGDTFLGGEDMDRNLAEVMSDRFLDEHGLDLRNDPQAFERLKAAAEWAKCQLSSDEAVSLTVEELATSRGRSLDLTFAMTRAELEQLAHPWIARSLQVCEGTIAAAGLRASELDSVVLVGGSTRMPLCRAMVGEYFGRVARTNIDPDLVVAQGAAIHGFALGGPREARPMRATPPARPGPKAERSTKAGMPRQPAFAPDEQPLHAPLPPRRPARSTAPPPPMPDLPAPASLAVIVQAAVNVSRKTIDADLDQLAPPSEDDERTLDALVPASLDLEDPFADLAPAGALAPAAGTLPLPTWDDELLALPPAPESVPRAASANGLRAHVPDPPREARPQPSPSLPLATTMPVMPIMAVPMAQPVVAMPERAPPLLMDVTPHSLGLETTGGYCKKIIHKNVPVPTEQRRTFTTAQDGQREVVVRVCQGENDHFADNNVLGEIVLDQLPDKRRGEVTIEVAFILDADATLAVEARDAQTGRSQRTRIALRGGLDPAEIDAMRARQQRELR